MITSVSELVRNRWPLLFQLRAQFLEIVNLAVENYPDGFFGVGHRLMAAGQIDNGKSAETETDGPSR